MNQLLAIVNLLPAIIAAIKAVEAAVPGAGLGKQKLEAVLDIVQAAHEGMVAYLPTINNVITILVRMFNGVGMFDKMG